jgi:hypothetical protein
MKSTDVRPGVPDRVFVKNGVAHFLEIKSEGGKPSRDQLACIERLERAGAVCAVETGLDACLRRLEAWQILRGRVA